MSPTTLNTLTTPGFETPGQVEKSILSVAAGRHSQTLRVVKEGTRFVIAEHAPGNSSVASRLSEAPVGENRLTRVSRSEVGAAIYQPIVLVFGSLDQLAVNSRRSSVTVFTTCASSFIFR